MDLMDLDGRLQICEFWNGMIAQDPEAKFHLNRAVNRHNCRYWCVVAPEITSEKTAVTGMVWYI